MSPQTFRPSVPLIYLALSVPLQIIIATVLGIQAIINYRTGGRGPTAAEWLDFGLTFAFCGLALMPVALFLSHRHRVCVGPSGMEIHNADGRMLIAWDAIETVDVVQWSGWRTIAVLTVAGRLAWIPVYVARGEAYREAVAHFAGEDHPIARALAAA